MAAPPGLWQSPSVPTALPWSLIQPGSGTSERALTKRGLFRYHAVRTDTPESFFSPDPHPDHSSYALFVL